MTAKVNLDDEVSSLGKGSIEFKILVDDRLLFASGVMTSDSATQEVNLEIPASAGKLQLLVGDSGDGVGYDHADWADAKCGASMTPVPTPIPTPAPTPAPIPSTTVTYTPSFENFRNPERGEIMVYQPGAAANGLPGNTTALAVSGVRDYLTARANTLPSSMVRLVYVLTEWKDVAIAQDFLDRLSSDLAVVRELGLKVVPYFAYTWSYDEAQGFDAPKDQILAHLEQLKPIFQGNQDIVAFVNAGFIGPWGEWHHSSNNNLSAPNDTVSNDTRAIMNKLLEVVPSNRMVALRYPGLKSTNCLIKLRSRHLRLSVNRQGRASVFMTNVTWRITTLRCVRSVWQIGRTYNLKVYTCRSWK